MFFVLGESNMVVLYEIAKRMLTPPSIVLLLLLAGFVLTLWRFQRLGRIMLAFGIIRKGCPELAP